MNSSIEAELARVGITEKIEKLRRTQDYTRLANLVK